jgi:hypothetical protein
MESKESKSKGKLSAKATTWFLWGGLVISGSSIFIPGQFCMDGCSFVPPNFALLGLGLILVGIACVTFASRKNDYRPALVLAALVSFLIAVDSLATSINGWFSVFAVIAEIVALPFVLVGFIIWTIARSVAKKRKRTQTSEAQPPSVE